MLQSAKPGAHSVYVQVVPPSASHAPPVLWVVSHVPPHAAHAVAMVMRLAAVGVRRRRVAVGEPGLAARCSCRSFRRLHVAPWLLVVLQALPQRAAVGGRRERGLAAVGVGRAGVAVRPARSGSRCTGTRSRRPRTRRRSRRCCGRCRTRCRSRRRSTSRWSSSRTRWCPAPSCRSPASRRRSPGTMQNGRSSQRRDVALHDVAGLVAPAAAQDRARGPQISPASRPRLVARPPSPPAEPSAAVGPSLPASGAPTAVPSSRRRAQASGR